MGDSVTASFGYCGTEGGFQSSNITCTPNQPFANAWNSGDNSLSDISQHGWFCMWIGWGCLNGSLPRSGRRFDLADPASVQSLRGGSRPAFPPDVLEGAKVRLPHRDYVLFEGDLDAVGELGAWITWQPGSDSEYHLQTPSVGGLTIARGAPATTSTRASQASAEPEHRSMSYFAARTWRFLNWILRSSSRRTATSTSHAALRPGPHPEPDRASPR